MHSGKANGHICNDNDKHNTTHLVMDVMIILIHCSCVHCDMHASYSMSFSLDHTLRLLKNKHRFI